MRIVTIAAFDNCHSSSAMWALDFAKAHQGHPITLIAGYQVAISCRRCQTHIETPRGEQMMVAVEGLLGDEVIERQAVRSPES